MKPKDNPEIEKASSNVEKLTESIATGHISVIDGLIIAEKEGIKLGREQALKEVEKVAWKPNPIIVNYNGEQTKPIFNLTEEDWKALKKKEID